MAEALGVVSSVIAVVDLSAKVFSLCLQYSREVKNAKDDIEKLREEVATFQATIKELQILVEGPHGKELRASQQLKSAVENGRLRLENLEKQLQPSTGRKRMSRFGIRALKWPFESKEVKGTIEDLESCRGTVSLALNIDQTAILQNVDDRTTLNQLPIAHGASFDSKAEEHNPICLPDTREELLKEIDRWIDDPRSKAIFWLNGMAGTGKSTISRTIARARAKRGDLGASFFFKRGEMDRGNMNKLMSTLAHQLALSIPGVASFIKKALDADLAIVGKSVKEQFEKLIQEPLSEAAATATTPSSIVMVIDALDECDQEADIRLLINIFSQTKTLRPHLRVFLTSRPELPIRLGFSEVQGSYQDLVLHDIPAQVVEHDIVVFLNDEFKKIRCDFNMTVGDERKLPSGWPGRPIVQSLAQMAVPLFIFAATVCRFVGDRKRDSPPIQLRKVLDYENKDHISQLDRTYGPVLRSLITDVSEDDKKQIVKDLKMIIGSIIILTNPLSVLALSQLLAVDPDVVDNRLDTLHSVLSIPLTRKVPVRLLHLSFRDYLITNEGEFRVDERHTHQTLAKHCLRVMRGGGLREDICGLTFPGIRRSMVESLELEERIPPQLQYACLNWAYHHIEGDPKPNNNNEVHDFLTTHFLHWVEALSLMGRVKECLDSLRSLARWLESQEDSNLSTFVMDAVRFLQANFSVITEAPLQIYSSCMVFAPSKSIIRNAFKEVIPTWMSSLPKVQEGWDACLLTLEGHSHPVTSVVFSHDSTKLASASDDKTVRIWNAETGDCERVMKGHSGSVNSVVFSHDLTKLASASRDRMVRIWNAKTGKCEQVLEGHSEPVKSVVFSHDSIKLASASWDNTIRIWRAETGDCVQVLEGHSDSVNSVVFSYDSTKLASASDDKTIRIWNAETGDCERVLEGHSSWVNSVVSSHDSTKLASSSWDEMIRIWIAETADCERVLEGHSDSVNSVVFSHNSIKLASASDDKTVRIWNAETGDCERVLKGHSHPVTSAVFSHDSTKLASASGDGTIRIWNTEIGDCERVLEGHSGWIISAVFSHDSTKLASASGDKTVRIWNAETGDCERVLEGHSDWVNSVMFSHDSIKLASASVDKTIRIWNAETGKCERVLVGHSGSVNSVVFSHDSTKLSSASVDGTGRIWNAETGICEDVVSLDVYADVLSFTPDERGIVTNRGVFALTGDLESCAEPFISSQSSEAPMLACEDGTWVRTAGTDLLWLPPECRDGRIAVSGSTVVVGCRSGRVIFLWFSAAETANIARSR